MLRFLGRTLVVGAMALGVVSLVAASPPVPRDPCTVLTHIQVQRLLLGKRVVRVRRRENADSHAVECTWVTGYFQTTPLRRRHAALSLQLTVQPVATATAALDELRARVRNPANETTETIPGLGQEAFSNLGDAIVVAGDLVVQVSVSNDDTAARPYPAVDAIARRAAGLVLEHLDRGPRTRGSQSRTPVASARLSAAKTSRVSVAR